jgi:hypothetical protein
MIANAYVWPTGYTRLGRGSLVSSMNSTTSGASSDEHGNDFSKLSTLPAGTGAWMAPVSAGVASRTVCCLRELG